MVFHFLFFTVRIERRVKTFEERYAHYRRDQQLREWEEAHRMEAARLPRMF
ncbi:YrzI family small protein [Brevibacillus humidisoli]|uniref:YrzI family small protein n=1 Tax=Brevibacillus humidisoli TaxID=2895522 RepID=UPI001E42C196|nr:YrzI family small protein [Brevibacillus humidisoli]UFJ41277.1 YrzI family small protein [Brevibacillus humidisoli]